MYYNTVEEIPYDVYIETCQLLLDGLDDPPLTCAISQLIELGRHTDELSEAKAQVDRRILFRANRETAKKQREAELEAAQGQLFE